MKVIIKNDHGNKYYFNVKELFMNNYMIQIIRKDNSYEAIAREENTQIITGE